MENAESPKGNTLPAMTSEEVQARAQIILDCRGMPPYTLKSFRHIDGSFHITSEEISVISEFVYFWLPFLSGVPDQSKQEGKGDATEGSSQTPK